LEHVSYFNCIKEMTSYIYGGLCFLMFIYVELWNVPSTRSLSRLFRPEQATSTGYVLLVAELYLSPGISWYQYSSTATSLSKQGLTLQQFLISGEIIKWASWTEKQSSTIDCHGVWAKVPGLDRVQLGAVTWTRTFNPVRDWMVDWVSEVKKSECYNLVLPTWYLVLWYQ